MYYKCQHTYVVILSLKRYVWDLLKLYYWVLYDLDVLETNSKNLSYYKFLLIHIFLRIYEDIYLDTGIYSSSIYVPYIKITR